MNPGSTVLPFALMIDALLGILTVEREPTSAIFEPKVITMPFVMGGRPVPSMMVPPMIAWGVGENAITPFTPIARQNKGKLKSLVC